MNININTFNNWAIKDKDIAMQKGHVNAVNQMFNLNNVFSAENNKIASSIVFIAASILMVSKVPTY